MRGRFEEEIRRVQNAICSAVEDMDGSKFHEDAWTRPGGGGGISRVLQVAFCTFSKLSRLSESVRLLHFLKTQLPFRVQDVGESQSFRCTIIRPVGCQDFMAWQEFDVVDRPFMCGGLGANVLVVTDTMHDTSIESLGVIQALALWTAMQSVGEDGGQWGR